METPSQQLPFFRKYPRLTLLGFNLLVCVILLLGAEMGLRRGGAVPGYLGPRPWEYVDLTRVDSLEEDTWFETGADGIFRGIPERFENDLETEVNSEGFRDEEFSSLDSSRTRILFIGDSFTWGSSAEPITECFVDRVESSGFECINLGIPGAEPNQYALIAGQYIPRFQPDVVCVMFFLGNDIMYDRIALGPFQNKYHQTNAGWLNPYLDGPHIPTAQATYDYYLAKYSIPHTETQLLNRWLAKSVIGTRIYLGLNYFWKEEAEEVTRRKQLSQSTHSDSPISHEYLKEIETLSEATGSEFILFALPEKGYPLPEIHGDYPAIFPNLEAHYPKTLKESDFNPFPDSHYNNLGHQKYADFILSVFEEKGIYPEKQIPEED